MGGSRGEGVCVCEKTFLSSVFATTRRTMKGVRELSRLQENLAHKKPPPP